MIDRPEERARLLLEFGEVIVLRAHQPPQRDVRAPGFLGGRGALVTQAVDLTLQREHRGEGLVRHGLADAERRDAERLERLPAHRALERDLEGGALIERLRLEQSVERGAESARDRAQLRELRLAPTVLDHRQLTGRAVDRARQLVERHAAFRAELSDAAADGEGVHLFIVGQFPALFPAGGRRHSAILSRKQNIAESSRAISARPRRELHTEWSQRQPPIDPERGSRDAGPGAHAKAEASPRMLYEIAHRKTGK